MKKLKAIVAYVVLVAAASAAVAWFVDVAGADSATRRHERACTRVLSCVDAGGERKTCGEQFPGCTPEDP